MNKLAFAFALVACTNLQFGCAGHDDETHAVDGENDSFLADGKADGGGVVEGSPEALGVLAVANKLGVAALDDDVGLDSRAAKNIVKFRSGPDTVLGSSDDKVFTTLTALDAVPYVGPAAFKHLLLFALAHDYVPDPTPERINIRIVGAVLAPAMADGSQWDLESQVSSDLLVDLAAMLLETDAYNKVLGLIARPLVQNLSKPDTYGTAELLGSSNSSQVTLATESNNTEDTFVPNWPGSPGWSNVTLSNTTRVRVTLREEDLFLDDDAGVVELNHADLEAAWTSQRVFPVAVADQSSRQVLFVLVSVSTAL
ncbi:MAG: hypothetical protein H0T46_13935 [Deltaproteobacteria bacterium]|nr:hypothetical protein [Deltaproteobacteria bacterium]